MRPSFNRSTSPISDMLKRQPSRIPEALPNAATHEDQHSEVPIKGYLLPKELYDHIVEAGIIKAKWRWDKQIVMGLIAAFYIGFSYTTMMVVGGQVPALQANYPGLFNFLLGIFGFPLGLFMICVVGADLFTSDCAYMMSAWLEAKISLYDVIKSWVVSWFVNCAGSIIMALLVYWAWIFHGRDEFTLAFAHKKVSNPFSVCLCKGILANWLVNLAVWIANSAQDITGKAIGIFLPISAFIAMGGEHCIANQYLFALAKLLGWEEDINDIIVKNLIPSTIGNIIGGAFFVSTMYAFAIGSGFDRTYALSRQLGEQIVQRYQPVAARLGFVGKLAAHSTSKSLRTPTTASSAGVTECVEMGNGVHQPDQVMYTGFAAGAVGSPKQDFIGIQVDGEHSTEHSNGAVHPAASPDDHAPRNSTDLCGSAVRLIPAMLPRVLKSNDGTGNKGSDKNAGLGVDAQAATLKALQQKIDAMGSTQAALLQQLQQKVDALASGTHVTPAHQPQPGLQCAGNTTSSAADSDNPSQDGSRADVAYVSFPSYVVARPSSKDGK